MRVVDDENITFFWLDVWMGGIMW